MMVPTAVPSPPEVGTPSSMMRLKLMSAPTLSLSEKLWSMFILVVSFCQSVQMMMDSFCMYEPLTRKLVLSVECWSERLWLWMNPVR